jgi:hypothetical protein
VNTPAQQDPLAGHDLHGTETSTKAIARRLRVVAGQRAEEFLSEVPATMRRVRTLLLVLSIAIPAFLLGLIVVLWHLAS